MTDFTVKRGDDRTLAATAYEADGETPQDLTSVTLFFTAKARRIDTDEDAIIAKDHDEIDIVDATSGTFEVPLEAADTDGLEAPLLLVWDLQGIDSVGAVLTLADGRMLIQPDITRRTEALGS